MKAARAGTAAAMLALALAVLGAATPAAAWDLALADTVTVGDGVATVADLATGPGPAAAADIVVEAGGRPGTCVSVARRTVLRRLVLAGAAGGVRLRGADRCVVVFAGALVSTGEVQEAARRAVQPLVPSPRAGAPDSWLELEIPARELPTDGGAWHVETHRAEPLLPGRNAVRFELVDGTRREAFPGTVVLHAYDEVATAVRPVDRGVPLAEDQFAWTWRDLAEVDGGLAVGRDAVQGTSAARTLTAGDALRTSDLRETPVILAGDPVEMTVIRGAVTVTVRGTARQPGCLGQTIPVRNELNGSLVNARVAGPGVVEWRR